MSGRPVPGARPHFLDDWQPIRETISAHVQPLMVVFLRGFWCDYCREQFLELSAEADAFLHRGVRLVAITTDEQMPEHLSDSGIPVLVDANGELIRSLDLVDPFEFRAVPVSLPAVFLLDGDGVVRYHYVGRSPDDRPRTELLLLAAEHLPTGTG